MYEEFIERNQDIKQWLIRLFKDKTISSGVVRSYITNHCFNTETADFRSLNGIFEFIYDNLNIKKDFDRSLFQMQISYNSVNYFSTDNNNEYNITINNYRFLKDDKNKSDESSTIIICNHIMILEQKAITVIITPNNNKYICVQPKNVFVDSDVWPNEDPVEGIDIKFYYYLIAGAVVDILTRYYEACYKNSDIWKQFKRNI